MKIFTVIALLFAVSALPTQASVIQWTYKANPLTLVGPPQPWDSLVEPNPYDGATLSISSELLDFSGGAVSADYFYNSRTGLYLSECDPNGTIGFLEGCLTVRSGADLQAALVPAGGASSGLFTDGASTLVFALSVRSSQFYGTLGNLRAVINPNLSITANLFFFFDAAGSGFTTAVGSNGDRLWGCEFGGCTFVPSFDRSQYPASDPTFSPLAQYSAPGGTWVLAAVPLPGSVYGLIAGLGALGMFARGRRRRAEGACNPR